MATIEEIEAALSTAMVEIATGRVQRMREGDKALDFINPNDLGKAMLAVRRAEDLALDNASATGGPCEITFLT
jgi:hypothetical protein